MNVTFSRLVLTVSVALCSQISFSQVGIGTTNPNPDALLDVNASTSTGGLLLPRLALTATTSPLPLTADVAGMTVYNTATAADVTPGFYYNDGAVWVRLGAGGAASWELLGNAGTNPATNFIGTTDAQDLVIRTNNNVRMRIFSNGRVAVNGNPGPSSRFSSRGGNGQDAIAGIALGATGRGVVGESLNGIGVYGVSDDAVGVHGFSMNDIGVVGDNFTAGGIGVEGRSPSIGVHGVSVAGVAVQSNKNTSKRGTAVLASGDLAYIGNTLTASDRKLKKNIKPITGALSILDKVIPKYFEMKWSDRAYEKMGLARTPQMGFIAQELEQVLPDLVIEKTIPLNNKLSYTKKQLQENPALAKIKSKRMEIKMVNYTQMIPLLTQAIKEQQVLIKKLTARIEKLEK